MKEYKRKFKVPGNTIKDCWDFRKKCSKKYGDNRPCQIPHKGSNYRYDVDKSRCPFPIDRPSYYIVSEMEDGTWKCSCPAWIFRRMKCDHIYKAQADPEKYEIAKEFTGKTTKALDRVFDGLGRDA